MPHNKVTLKGFDQAIFSDGQLALVEAEAEALQKWVESYRILPECVDMEEAEEFDAENPGQVFTSYFSPTSLDAGTSMRYGIVPGIFEDGDDFFLSEVACEDDSEEYPYTIIDFICSVCEGSTCSNCQSGELSIDITWDKNWVVTAEFSRELEPKE